MLGQRQHEHKYHLFWLYYRTIGAVPPPAGTDDDANTAAAVAAVRFVSIDRRCCCGAPVIRSACDASTPAPRSHGDHVDDDDDGGRRRRAIDVGEGRRA